MINNNNYYYYINGNNNNNNNNNNKYSGFPMKSAKASEASSSILF